MLAHPASISSLDVDETGETLITSCHESSIRFWNIGSRKCDQDLSAHQTHRRKNDEGITDICAHPCQTLIASAGADGIVKLYNV